MKSHTQGISLCRFLITEYFTEDYDNLDLVTSTLRCAVHVCAQLYLTLGDPMDCSPPDFSVCGISREESWPGLPFPPPGDLPDSGIKPEPPASPALTGDKPPGNPHSDVLGFNSNFLEEESTSQLPFHYYEQVLLQTTQGINFGGSESICFISCYWLSS